MIKRGLALIVAVFAMVQLAGGTLPAEAEEPAAMYETVTRADGGVAELVETDARRTMTVRTPEGNETTTVECEDGSITTISSENGCTRIAVSLSQSACEAAKMAPFVLPIARWRWMRLEERGSRWNCRRVAMFSWHCRWKIPTMVSVCSISLKRRSRL